MGEKLFYLFRDSSGFLYDHYFSASWGWGENLCHSSSVKSSKIRSSQKSKFSVTKMIFRWISQVKIWEQITLGQPHKFLCSDECLCAILVSFHLGKDTVTLIKVERRGIKKVGERKLLLCEQKQSRLGVCGLEGKETEGKCGRSKITDLDGKVNYGIVIPCLSEQKN